MKRALLRGALLTLLLLVLLCGCALAFDTDATLTPGTGHTGTVVPGTSKYLQFEVTAPSQVYAILECGVAGQSVSIVTALDEPVEVASKAVNGAQSGSGARTDVAAWLNPGTYWVKVFPATPAEAGGSYSVTFSRTSAQSDLEPNDTLEGAQAIAFPANIVAMQGFQDRDCYKFTLSEATSVALRTGDHWQCKNDTYALYDGAKQLIKSGQIKPADDHTDKSELAAGTYYLAIETSTKTHSYAFCLEDGSSTQSKTAQSIKLTPEITQLTSNTSQEITVVMTPATAEDEVLLWESSNPEVLSIDLAGYSKTLKCRVNALVPGTATLKCTMKGGATGQLGVTVPKPALTGIRLETGTCRITKGFMYTPLRISAVPDQATLPAAFAWSSSNPAVLEVGADGTLTGKGYGTATLTAAADGTSFSATCQVTVGKNQLTRSRPLFDKNDEEGIYSCAKRMYYSGKYLYAEVFLYNNTGYKISKKGNLKLLVFDWDVSEESPVYTKTISWNPGTITKYKWKVLKYRLPKGKLLKRDLGTGQLEMFLTGNFKAKRLTLAKSRAFWPGLIGPAPWHEEAP